MTHIRISVTIKSRCQIRWGDRGTDQIVTHGHEVTRGLMKMCLVGGLLVAQ
jgi:hypothetical protein